MTALRLSDEMLSVVWSPEKYDPEWKLAFLERLKEVCASSGNVIGTWLYPRKRPQLNLLQRAVLGLVRAKTVRAEDLAELTGLHLNLIKLIQAQCVSNGWLVDNAACCFN